MYKKFVTVILLLGSTLGVSSQTTVPTDSLVKELQEIVVTARQPATRLVGTTLVSTIAGSALQNLESCRDVLAQLPMISVQDDVIQIAGKGEPEIFIDGRPLRDGDELMLIQASNLKKVELVLAPGAMYSGDTKAVLKIYTKRNFLDGLSLTEQANMTVRRKWSANNMLDINYRKGEWDFFATGVIARNNSLIHGSTTNILQYDGRETVVGGSQRNSYPTVNGSAKGGFNFASGDRSLGMYYRFSPERGDFENVGTEWIDDTAPINRTINKNIKSRGHYLSSYYDETFGGRYNFHFDGDYHRSLSRDGSVTSYPSAGSGDVSSNDRRKSSLWAGKAYVSFPVGKGSFTAGAQGSYTGTTLDYKMLNAEVGEYIPSSFTDARQTSVVAFSSWSRVLGRFSLSAGVRYEYIDYKFEINGKKDEDVSRDKNLLTPDVSLGWRFNDESQVGLSYRVATVKPPYSHLTGSLTYVGRHEIEGGNPLLRDEKMHDIQLFGMWSDFVLQIDFARSFDTYAFVKKIYPANDLQFIMQPVNIDISSLDLFLVWSRNILKWTPDFTVGLHKQWLSLDGTKYNRPYFVYYLDNLVSFKKDFQLTVNVHGQTSGDMHTNRFAASRFVTDLGIRKTFFNNTLAVKLEMTDVFNSRNNDWSMNTYGIKMNKIQSYDRRGVALSIRYQLRPQKSKYKGKPAAEAEMKRL